MAIKKDLAEGQYRNRLHRATSNGVWLSTITQRHNGTYLSWEEFRDNILLRYGLMPQDIPATFDGWDNRLLIEQALSCPKGGPVCVMMMLQRSGAPLEPGP